MHVVLSPGVVVEVLPLDTRVVFFNGTPGSTVHFSIDGGTECVLKANQFTTRTVAIGEHQIDAYHWDVFKMAGRTTLDIDGAELFVAVFPTVYSTRAAFANEPKFGAEVGRLVGAIAAAWIGTSARAGPPPRPC